MLRVPRRLAAMGRLGVWPSCGLSAIGAAAILAVVAALIPVLVAQSSRRPQPGLAEATRALIAGRYDDVPSLLEKLDAQDPDVAAVKARALIARGRYEQAESELRPIAQKAPTSEAALELGLLQQMLGRSGATATLTRVAALGGGASDAAALARGGRALRAIGSFQDANAAYRDAVALAPRDPAINAAWGELFLEKYQRGEALKSFQAALKEDPKYAPALLGAARSLADDNPPQAVVLAKQVLDINPSDVGAHVFLAGEVADAGTRDEARALLGKALAINPSSLEAISLVAALDYVEDKTSDFEAQVAKALTLAPSYGEIYRTAGDLAARNYRFDEAVTLTRRALDLDPRNARSLAALGVHLLRTGDEPGAREVLEAAFKIDGFDVVTYNLLQMMDTLDTFVTATDGDIVLRMHKAEAPVLQDHALRLARQALTTLGKRYAFTPKGPILIEMFPKHDDFAVRNVGLPGMIGALGACFGRVVTLDSPKARPPGEFQWEATLWHELAHVITIQMSNQRVPRWLTEGISVYEETLQRSDWGRGMDVAFAGMLNSGETLKLTALNAAFTNPKTISLAYYQASLLVEHLVDTFGDAGLHRLLGAYGKGLESDAALKSALDTDFDRLQSGFDQFVDRRFGSLRAALKTPDEDEFLRMPLEALVPFAEKNRGSYPVQLVLGRKLLEAGSLDDALRAFERAAALVPIATGPDSPNVQIALIALQRKDIPRAITALQAVMAADFDNIDVARQLAKLMRESNVTDPSTLQPVYARIAAVDPYDAEAHRVLGRLALQRGEPDTAIREFRTVVALGPVDQAAALTDLAESYFLGGRRAEARKQTLAALEVAPSYERAQDLLLKLAAEGETVTRGAWRPVVLGLAGLILTLAPALPPAGAQLQDATDDRFAGLQWRFVRIKYHYVVEGTSVQQDFYGEPWYIDAPAAEQNLSRRLKSATSIQVEDPIVLSLDDPRLFMYPWIYIVEPGNLKLTEQDVKTLREFLLRGGTLTFDDFHGPIEWDHMAAEMKRVFPDRSIVEVPKDHPVFSSFYRLEGYPQIAGLGSFFAGRTWEKGGYIAHLRMITDDTGRPMVFINWNTDMGDGWEWSNAEDYPGYIRYTSLAYRMGINEIVYTLTH